MILVDSSVWIDFFSSTPRAAGRELRGMIAKAEPVALTGIVVTEVLQGLIRDIEQVEPYLSMWTMLEPRGFLHISIGGSHLPPGALACHQPDDDRYIDCGHRHGAWCKRVHTRSGFCAYRAVDLAHRPPVRVGGSSDALPPRLSGAAPRVGRSCAADRIWLGFRTVHSPHPQTPPDSRG